MDAEFLNIPIIQARQEHTLKILELISACVQALRKQGLDQWDDIYPAEEIVRKDVSAGSVYLLEKNDHCLATITLNHEQDPAYKTIQWNGGEPVLVIHRLCVHPANQGKGIAGCLMDFAEQYAKQNSYASIRLDAYTLNSASIRLYKGRGYQVSGEVYFPRRSAPFYCFEKILTLVRDSASELSG